MGRSLMKRQRGATLFIALVFLVMLTVIGISMFGKTTAEEKMSRNYRDYNVALQAAEAALRDAEIRVTGYWVYKDSATALPKPVDVLYFSSDCLNGLCGQDATQPVYSAYSMSGSPSVGLGDCPGGCDGKGGGTGTGSPTFPTAMVHDQPRYLVEVIPWNPPGESLGSEMHAFRISAIGTGRMATTHAMLQEIYVPPSQQ